MSTISQLNPARLIGDEKAGSIDGMRMAWNLGHQTNLEEYDHPNQWPQIILDVEKVITAIGGTPISAIQGRLKASKLQGGEQLSLMKTVRQPSFGYVFLQIATLSFMFSGVRRQTLWLHSIQPLIGSNTRYQEMLTKKKLHDWKFL